MNIRKAVITAAGRGVRQYPAADTVQKAMLPLIDRDGVTKPVLQIIGEEALESGIESIAVITAPGDENQYHTQFQGLSENLMTYYKGSDWAREQSRRLKDLEHRIRFIPQTTSEGYGHAVWCAKEFVGDEPFLLLLGDHLYISDESRRCAEQIIDLAREMECAAAAVQATREHLIHQYGTISGKRIPGKPYVYQIEEILEKPNLSVAESRLQVPGLRLGHYLCFFGMHVLTPLIFEILEAHIRKDVRDHGEIQLTPALQELAQREKYMALETKGRRYDIGIPYGYVKAQTALALAGVDREKVLTDLIDILSHRD